MPIAFSLWYKRSIRRRRLHQAVQSGSIEQLDQLISADERTICLAARAAKAVLHLGDRDIRPAQHALNGVYEEVRGADDPERHLIRLYCLYYLAAIRGAHSDCFIHAKKARHLKDARGLWKAIGMPKPVERNVLGSFVTAIR